MNINFTGIKAPKISVCRKGSILDADNIGSDEKVHTIRMNCYLDNANNSDLDEFKRVISKDHYISNKFNNFTENDCLQIEMSPSTQPQNFGYSININGEEVTQWNNSIFGICTFLCAITRSLLKNNELTPNVQKYIKAMNIVSAKIGNASLKYVK